MIVDSRISDKAKLISAVLANLQREPNVESAVLCTEDGLAVNGQAVEQTAAVASFLIASAQQASAILGRKKDTQEITIRMGNNSLLVCWPFVANDTSLIIASIFKKEVAYKRLLSRTADAIQQAIER